MLKNLPNLLLDVLYPPQCHFCSQNLRLGEYLCEECKESLELVKFPYCEQCGEPFDGLIHHSFDCPNCHDVEHAFDFAIAALRDSEQGRDLVHSLKYKRQRHLAKVMAKLMAERFWAERRCDDIEWLLVPTPLHWTRRFQRHFNQSDDLVEMLSEYLGCASAKWLVRKRRTITQTRLNRAHRLKNLNGAFKLKTGANIQKPINIILVDDVLTTGSTAHECAKTLKQAENVEKVVVLTLLRG